MTAKLVSEKEKIDKIIYSPADAVTDTAAYLEEGRRAIHSGLGLHFPIPSIAASYPVPPLLPGKVFTVAAVTSHGKSTFKDFWKGDAARRIEEAKDNKHILIDISTEDMVEEQMADTMRRKAARDGKIESIQSEEGLLVLAGEISSVPIYYIGVSVARASFDLPPINMTNVYRACARIIERRKDKLLDTVVMGVFLDYVQALDIDHDLMSAVADKRRHLQVKRDFFTFRRLCSAIPAPGVCCAQCKIELKYAPGPNMRTPGLEDIQESSAIAQHTDRGLSLWMPWRTHRPKEVLDHGTVSFRVIPELTWMRITKQRCKDPMTLRGLPAGRIWPLDLDFDSGTYTPFNKPEDTLKRGLETRRERRTRHGKDPDDHYDV